MNFKHIYKKLSLICFFIFYASIILAQKTIVSGTVTDAKNKKTLPFVSVAALGSSQGVSSNNDGRYHITLADTAAKLKFSYIGYQDFIVKLKAGVEQVINVRLIPVSSQLQEVTIHSGKKPKYRNKDNPAVELIRKVIENKEKNQPESYAQVEYKEYDKIQFSLVNVSSTIGDKKLFRPYKFMFDNRDSTSVPGKSLLPFYLDEKVSQYYYRKDPEKEKTTTLGQKTVDFGGALDSQGLAFYLKYIVAKVDIYSNNILLLGTPFLSPIAGSSPTFYKFFITDTVEVNNHKLVELSFTPRNTADQMLEGKMYITLDGNYAVEGDEMTISKHINVNFVNALAVDQAFEQNPDGRFHLSKSTVSASFAFNQKKTGGLYGLREIVYGNYVVNNARPDSTYKNQEDAVPEEANHRTDDFWKQNRLDTLSTAESKVYKNVDSLRNMKSFRRTLDWAMFFLAGYKDVGKFEIGPSNAFYAFNPIEGAKLRFGGRTTPDLSKRYYFETYAAYGFRDEKWKGFLSATYSLNSKSIYQFPQNYIRASVQYDTYIPGENFQFVDEDNLLLSFKRGDNTKFIYELNPRLTYVHEFNNHFSYTFGFESHNESPTGSLYFTDLNSNNQQQSVHNLLSTDLTVGLRYAPNEQFYQGKIYRYDVPSKNPIFSLDYDEGLKNVFNGQYSFQKLHARIDKRVYLSVLGYADVTTEAAHLFGQVPYPLLDIFHANQTYSYQIYSYNLMNFLEFVSDHYESISIDQHFQGFFFNKIPLLKKLKWRETASFKGIWGGLSSNNDPSLHPSLYQFPIGTDGRPITYALGKTPYMEASVGIENIFKFVRLDLVHRFTYLDHPDVAKWGIRTLVQVSF
jgi:Family of unknown function (DUF5686)/CarboxypepD_reg-like domain